MEVDSKRSLEDDDEENQESSRDKFRKEREDSPKDTSHKRDRDQHSPNQGRKREKYDDFGRIKRDSDDDSPTKDRSRSRSASPHKSPDRRENPRRDPGRDRRRRDSSLDRDHRRRDTSPKRRRGGRDDDYYDDRSKRGRHSWGGFHEDDRRRRDADIFEGPMKGFKQFRDYQDPHLTSSELEKKFEEYKTEYRRKQVQTFFNDHKGEEWFKERFDPTYLEKRRNDLIEISKKNAEAFQTAVLAGEDFSLDPEAHPDDIHEPASHPNDDKEEKEEKMDEEETKEETKEENKEESKEESKTDVVLTSQTNENNAVFIKAVPPNIGRQELLDIFKSTPGFQSLTLSEPNRLKKYYRLGWVTYDTAEACLKTVSSLNGHKMAKDFELSLAVNKTPPNDTFKKVKTTPATAGTEERIAKDLETARKLIEMMDVEKGLENSIFKSMSSVPDKTKLDRMIVYLRRVHFYCYYCAEEYDGEDDLRRRCGKKHIRSNLPEDSNVPASWADAIDAKNKIRLEHPDQPNVYTGVNLFEKKLQEYIEKNVTHTEPDRSRCTLCKKLFGGDQFLKKHIKLKHVEFQDELKIKALEAQYFENYYSDPKRPYEPPSTVHSKTTDNQRNDRFESRGDRRGGNRSSNYNNNGHRGDRGPRGQGRGRGGRFQRPAPPIAPMLDAPPGMEADPRAIREYRDLDAVQNEGHVEIDYFRSFAPTKEDK